MCMPLQLLAAGASTMIKMGAQQKAAEATAKNERRVAAQMLIDREMGKVQAMQNQNARVAEYISAEKSNLAVFSASGVDVDSASYQAFQEANAVTVGEDLNAIALQTDYQSRTKTIEAGLATERSSNALSAGYANMMGTATEGIYNMANILTDESNSISDGIEFFTTPFDLI